MPISNRTPPKVLAGNLAINETKLRKAKDGIEGAESFPFTADDKAVLDKAKDVLLNARIRTEFPVVARILDDVVKRTEGGESLQWTPEQTKGFLNLVGELSFAENDTLNKLRDLGVIPQGDWDSFVKPHKDATNEAQGGAGRKLKYGSLSFGAMMPTMVLGFGVAMAVGGPAGALMALAASTTFGMTAGTKLQEKIQSSAFLENAKLGVNASAGKEVTSEAMVITTRAAAGDVFRAGNFLDHLKQEQALGDMMVQARASSDQPISPLEQPFIDIAAQYLEGLGPIIAKYDAGKLTEIDARKAVMELRGQALDANKLDGVAKAALATYVNHPDGQKLVFLRQLAETSEQLVEHLAKNGGKADATMRGEAAAMIQIYSATGGQLGTLSLESLAILASVANNVPLDATQQAILKKDVMVPAQTMRDELEPKLVATKDVAISQAKAAFDVLWGTVVPSFNDIKDAPVAKGITATKLPDGGYEVSGKFKGGFLAFMGIGSTGEFKVKISDAGHVDPASMKIDLGEKFAKFAGEKALEMWTKNVGIGAGVHSVGVDDKKTDEGRYVVRGGVGDLAGKVEVSALGLVAWNTLKVT